MNILTRLSNSAYVTLFTYNTVRMARIKSWKLGVMFRMFQFIIIGYIIGWNIIYKRGYQMTAPVAGTVTTKVKGLGFTSTNGQFDAADTLVYDTGDYVTPPIEHSSAFIMTNFIKTKQTQGVCEEDYIKVAESKCQIDDDCKFSDFGSLKNWNGIPTGKCITSSTNSSIKVCEIKSWCPIEREPINKKENMIHNVLNFTIFIKNDVQFKQFNKRQNILPNISNNYISGCIYSKDKDPFCPVFQVKTILDEAEPDRREQELMLQKGGVIQIEINWNCNYDLGGACLPRYSFHRYDLPFKEASAASGFNFRYSDKFEQNGNMNRVLTKAYGLRFVISLSGKAGKFNVIPLFISLGAGLGLLGVATLVADFILLNLTPRKDRYQQVKRLVYRPKQEIKLDTSQKLSQTMLSPI